MTYGPCPRCGEPATPGAGFCVRCGTPLDSLEHPAPPVQWGVSGGIPVGGAAAGWGTVPEEAPLWGPQGWADPDPPAARRPSAGALVAVCAFVALLVLGVGVLVMSLARGGGAPTTDAPTGGPGAQPAAEPGTVAASAGQPAPTRTVTAAPAPPPTVTVTATPGTTTVTASPPVPPESPEATVTVTTSPPTPTAAPLPALPRARDVEWTPDYVVVREVAVRSDGAAVLTYDRVQPDVDGHVSGSCMWLSWTDPGGSYCAYNNSTKERTVGIRRDAVLLLPDGSTEPAATRLGDYAEVAVEQPDASTWIARLSYDDAGLVVSVEVM